MKKLKLLLGTVVLCVLALTTKAQISGTFSITVDYPTIAAAIIDLNTQGVNGPVTILVPAGYTETAPTGGYTLTATGTLANPIVFQKNGVGVNPQITAYVGTQTPGTAVQDGIWRFIGSDYITIDGIDLFDNNVANPATMEFGYGFFKASVTDGCQNNTIKNCSISLNKVNNASGTAPAVDGSRGIDVVNATTAAHTTNLTITAASGSNSNNKFYSNTIQNCNIGIALIGFSAASPYALADTGNDIGGASVSTGNMIVNYGGGATTNPAAAVRTLNQYSLNVSYNVVNNNNGGGTNHGTTLRGIYINTAPGANATISSNTITVKSGATTSQLSAIENASGATPSSNTITISNNVITGCTYTTATSGTFYGIYNNGGAAAYLNVIGNTITGLTLNSTAGSGAVNFIYNGSTISTSLSVKSNTIQNIPNLNTSGTIYFIYSSNATNSYAIQGNYVNNVSRASGLGGSMYGFYNFGSPTSGTATIDGNTFTNINAGTGANTFYGIYQATSTSQVENVTNNLISTISCGSTNLYGIYHSYGNTGSSVSGNTVNALTGTGPVYGIANGNTASSSLSVTNNFVYTLLSSGASGVYGIYQNGGTATSTFKNKVYDISGTNASSTVYGLYITAGTTSNVYNNLIGDIKAPVANAAIPVAGIYISGGTTSNVYYNSVYLNATSSGALFGSAALYVSTTPNINLRNNILVNTSGFTGAGITAAYRRTGTSLTTYSSTSNNNLFYAGTPSANNVIFYDGTTVQQTLGGFKTLVSPRDASSITENPTFVSTTGSNANFLNINTVTPTQIESGGAAVTGITDDYAGTTRNVTTPDIGAWEGNYVYADLSAPSLIGSGFTTSPCILTGRTFTVNLTDPSGVASGSLSPRVYYKVNNGAYTSVAGTLSSGTALNGVWTFNLTYSAVSLDVISYFLVAQDAASTPNLASYPSPGFSGTDVNTVTTPPTTPNTYVVATLGGVYTVGAAGTFTSLTQAASVYNIACLTSAVTFSLIDATYSTAETFPVTFLNNADASATNSLLIVPAAGLNVAVTGSTNSTALFKFLNSRYITIDGLNTGGSSITLNNNNTGSSANVWLASSGAGNNNIGIRNLTINGGSGTSSNAYGILSSLDGAGVTSTGGADNDNITIQGNTIANAYFGIYAIGTAAVSTGGLDNWSINSNKLGPVVSGTNNIGYAGIQLQNALLGSVHNNTISNVTASGSNYIFGLNINMGVSSYTVSNNTISSIKYLGTGGYGGIGIDVNTNTGTSNILFRNNMISDCTGDAWSSFTAGAFAGIRVGAVNASGGLNFYHNTVAMNQGTTVAGYSTGNRTAAMYFASTSTNIDIRDNILYSNVQYTNTASKTYAIYSAAANTAFTNINYNDYFVSGTQGYLGFISSADQVNLTAVQTSFGQNANSMNVLPVFTSTNDLHLVPASNVALDNFGTPLASVTTDIDNQTRSGSSPDMGADEYTSPVCTTANGGTLSVASFTACAGQTLALNSTGFSTGINTVYQWQVSTTSGGPYSNVTGGVGATTTSYTTAALTAGTYFYVLQTTCTSASLSAVSNEGTLTINQVPTATITSNAPICSGSNLNLNGGTNVGTNFNWSGPAGFTSTTQNPVITNAPFSANGTYTLIVSTSNCTAAAVTLSVPVIVTPGAITASPTSATLCSGNSQTITATGGVVAPATFTFGTGTNQNSSTSYPAPYTAYYGGQRMQMLVLASELTAAGFSTGSSITSLEFPVVSKGSNWGTSISDCKNFQVNIANTLLTSLTSFQSGLTNVVPVSNFTPVVGYGNTHTFASSFIWDGVSNIILETTFSNNFTGGSSDAIIQYTTSTPFNSTIVYRADGVTAPAIATGTTVNVSVSARPDFKLNSVGFGSYSWSPAAGLSATSGSTVVATPASSTVYSVTVANGACSSSATTSITVNTTPTVNVSATSNTICSGSSSTLTASGATTYSWNTTATTNSIVAAPTTTTSYTVTGTSGSCSNSTVVTVNVNALPTVVVTGTNAVCDGQTATLTASGANTYSWSDGSTGTSISPTFTASITYTVTGTDVNNCVNTATQSVTVNPNPTVTVAGGAICPGDSFTLSPGGAVTYTYLPSGPVVNPGSTTSYSVTGTDALGCVSQTAAVAVVTVTNNLTVTITGSTAICNGQSASLTANGAATYSWSTGAATNTIAPSPTSNTSYTVTGSSGSCSNTAVVNVTVNALPSVSLTAAQTTVCINSSTIALTGSPSGGVYTGSNVTTGVFTPGAVAGTFTPVYTYTDGVTGCSNSANTSIVVDLCTGVDAKTSALANLQVYPNPNSGEFTIELNNGSVKTAEVMDVTGRIVTTATTANDKMVININALANGVYFVRLQSNNEVEVIKVVKQ